MKARAVEAPESVACWGSTGFARTRIESQLFRVVGYKTSIEGCLTCNCNVRGLKSISSRY